MPSRPQGRAKPYQQTVRHGRRGSEQLREAAGRPRALAALMSGEATTAAEEGPRAPQPGSHTPSRPQGRAKPYQQTERHGRRGSGQLREAACRPRALPALMSGEATTATEEGPRAPQPGSHTPSRPQGRAKPYQQKARHGGRLSGQLREAACRPRALPALMSGEATTAIQRHKAPQHAGRRPAIR